MPIDLPIYQPQTVPGNTIPVAAPDFAGSVEGGYRLGRIIAGIPQQQDALKIAQMKQQLEQSGQEFPLIQQLRQQELLNAPVDRQLKILQGITAASPGFVNPGEPGSTMPEYPSEGVVGGPSGTTLGNVVPKGGVGVPAADIQQRRIQDLNAQVPSDTVPLNFPGIGNVKYSPSKEATFKTLMLTAPLMRAEALTDYKNENTYLPTTDVDPATKLPIYQNKNGDRIIKPNGVATPFTGQGLQKIMASPIDPQALKGMVDVYRAGGPMPSFGRGGASSPMGIAFFSVLGGKDPNDPNLISEGMSNKAYRTGVSSALKNQEVMYQANKISYDALDKQLSLIKDLSNKVDRSGVPAWNRYLLYLKKDYAGDEDTSKLENAINTGTYEFSKILGGSAASIQGVTIKSSEDAQKYLTSSMTPSQIAQNADLMIKEGKFKLDSAEHGLNDMRNELKQIGIKPSEEVASPQESQKTRVVNGVTYTQHADGKWYK